MWSRKTAALLTGYEEGVGMNHKNSHADGGWKFDTNVIDCSAGKDKLIFELLKGKDEFKELDKELNEGNDVIIMNGLELKINTLLNAYPSLEWMGILTGKLDDKLKAYVAEDMSILDQEVSGATVKLTKEGEKQLASVKNVIGWIHSHNKMSSFQSCTDDDTAGNFTVSITVNNKREYAVKIKKKLKCGKSVFVKGNAMMDNEYYVDSSFEEESKKMIKEEPGFGGEYDYNPMLYYPGETYWQEGNDDYPMCYTCGQPVGKKGVACKTCNFPYHKKCLMDQTKQGDICEECESEGDGFTN